ncbi:unnamed protein product [Brugia timori]|uniref:Ribose-phosphate pyrophosphokinase n=1 Tax=Brugia timori TaxID=42155 RepID=A0A0R3R0H3_9BILA|nr:unnamed protein product [Brugia timori]
MNSKIRNVCVGKLSAETFAQALGKMNLKYSRSEINGNDTLNASVCIKNGGFRTVISSSSRENRQLLSKAVARNRFFFSINENLNLITWKLSVLCEFCERVIFSKSNDICSADEQV